MTIALDRAAVASRPSHPMYLNDFPMVALHFAGRFGDLDCFLCNKVNL
jgi:hypothetical protein